MPTKYDELLYPTAPRASAHPERLATMAYLAGLNPAPLARCRVLELGCGDGGNLIPIAHAYPESEFLGVDLAERPLAAGREFATVLGLSNIEFLQGDLTNWSAPGREFDYILVHGVYSWVPEPAREGILRICQQHLAPAGVAFISYNALPGCYFRQFVWDMLKFHTRGITEPDAKIAAARKFTQQAIDALEDSPLPSAVREELEEVLSRDGQVVFHDDLSEFNVPFYVEQFTADAARHGLQYLGDAGPAREHGLPYQVETTSRAHERQYADFATARRFRETLLCRAGLPLAPEITLDRLLDLWVGCASEAHPEDKDGVQAFDMPYGRKMSTNHPAAKAVILAASAAWPCMIPARQLPLAGQTPEESLGLLLRLFLCELLEFRLEPPLVAGVTARPRSSSLARAQLALGRTEVCTQRHRTVKLTDELARQLVRLLDGTLNHAEIAAALAATPETQNLSEALPQTLATSLRMLARMSLLVG